MLDHLSPSLYFSLQTQITKVHLTFECEADDEKLLTVLAENARLAFFVLSVV